MGQRSVKENKNVYFQTREELKLTRDEASEKMEYVSADRIEKIENERSLPHPEEILAMSKCYNAPNLCNYYCSHECPIGQEYVPEIEMKALSQITLEMLASLNEMEAEKRRLIEITVDGKITSDELDDFKRIQKQLTDISMATQALNLWVKKTIAEGEMEN